MLGIMIICVIFMKFHLEASNKVFFIEIAKQQAQLPLSEFNSVPSKIYRVQIETLRSNQNTKQN